MTADEELQGEQERKSDFGKSEPLVTVITPNYNQAKYLEETIESILAQDYQNIEYIVIDDGSTDHSVEILRRYDGRLSWLTHANIGETRTVNKALTMATGEIVVVINADDPLYAKTAVSEAVKCFKTCPDALAVYADWVTIDEHGKVLNEVRLPEYNIENMLKGFKCELGPAMFIRKEALIKIGLRDERIKYTGDLDISFRLAVTGKLAYLPSLLGTHRVHSTAQSATGQGAIMAREVAALAEKAFMHPNIPQSCLQAKGEILANAYYVASHYCGSARWECIRLLVKSIASTPSKRAFNRLTSEMTEVFKCFFGKSQSNRS